MKCQICRENESNIVFTKIVNNEKMVLNICLECAKKKGLTVEIAHPFPDGAEPAVSHEGAKEAFEFEGTLPDLVCERCGTTFVEFKKTGLFGCDRCHDVFGTYFIDILKKIHESTVHEGKSPLGSGSAAELKKHLRTLKMRLKRCIDSEEYERAAELRDKITTLEGKMQLDGI